MNTAAEQITPDTNAMLAELLRKLDRPEEKEMWTIQDIAIYTGLSRDTVQKVLTKRVGFPSPVIPLGNRKGHKIWPAKEVKAWLMRNRPRR